VPPQPRPGSGRTCGYVLPDQYSPGTETEPIIGRSLTLESRHHTASWSLAVASALGPPLCAATGLFGVHHRRGTDLGVLSTATTNGWVLPAWLACPAGARRGPGGGITWRWWRRPGGWPAAVQEYRGGRDEGGGQRDHGDLPAGHAAGRDHPDRGDRRCRDRPPWALPGRGRRGCLRRWTKIRADVSAPMHCACFLQCPGRRRRQFAGFVVEQLRYPQPPVTRS
jgi:hypothetical protein